MTEPSVVTPSSSNHAVSKQQTKKRNTKLLLVIIKDHLSNTWVGHASAHSCLSGLCFITCAVSLQGKHVLWSKLGSGMDEQVLLLCIGEAAKYCYFLTTFVHPSATYNTSPDREEIMYMYRGLIE